MLQRTVALNVNFFSLGRYSNEGGSNGDTNGSTSSPERRGKGRQTLSAQVAEILQCATQGPGLSFLKMLDMSDHSKMEPIWKLLLRHAPNLRDLHLFSMGSLPRTVLEASDFTRLEALSLSAGGTNQSEPIDNFLDHAKDLRNLHVDLMREAHFSLRQNFPRLRSVNLPKVGFGYGPGASQSFAERHPHVVEFGGNTMSMETELNSGSGSSFSHLSSPIFPNLRRVFVRHLSQLQAHVEAGRTFRSIGILSSAFYDPEKCFTFIQSNAALAQDITSFEVRCMPSLDHVGIISEVLTSFGSQFFPNLTELQICCLPSRKAGADSLLHAQICQLMEALVSARSLKVLRLCPGHKKSLSKIEKVLGKQYPPALQYFIWEPEHPRKPQYFRFVSSHSQGGIAQTATGGKIGRLQQVPEIFRTQITSTGVWKLDQRPTLFDHLSDEYPALPRD